jgi:PhoPQ-activated pathogenicity-related protein
MIGSLFLPKNLDHAQNDLHGNKRRILPFDAVKNYIDSIPGENISATTPMPDMVWATKNSTGTLSAFFGSVITKTPVPKCEYTVSSEKGKITITMKTDAALLADAIVWSATSNDREFRQYLDKYPVLEGGSW